MTELSRPKRFQIHLSTAIVMMFSAGTLLWVNIGDCYAERLMGGLGGMAGQHWYVLERGWPDPYYTYYIGRQHPSFPDGKDFSIFHLFSNVFVALILQASIWSACEYLIRRRAREKGA